MQDMPVHKKTFQKFCNQDTLYYQRSESVVLADST